MYHTRCADRVKEETLAPCPGGRIGEDDERAHSSSGGCRKVNRSNPDRRPLITERDLGTVRLNVEKITSRSCSVAGHDDVLTTTVLWWLEAKAKTAVLTGHRIEDERLDGTVL